MITGKETMAYPLQLGLQILDAVEGNGHSLLRLDCPRLGRLAQLGLLFQQLVNVLVNLLVVVLLFLILLPTHKKGMRNEANGTGRRQGNTFP